MRKLLQGFLSWFRQEPAGKETSLKPRTQENKPNTNEFDVKAATPDTVEARNSQGGTIQPSTRTPEGVKIRPSPPLDREPPASLPRGIRRRQDKIHIQVGVDFGTSSCKIAYRHLGARTEIVRPILFRHNLPHFPSYCLPSLAAFDDAGSIAFGEEAAKTLLHKDVDYGLRLMKIVLAGRYDQTFRDIAADELFQQNLVRNYGSAIPPTVEQIVTAFIAYVLRKVRSQLKEQYPNNDLDIAYNVCIPIDYEQNNPVRDVFEKILRAAERVEFELEKSCSSNDLLERAAHHYSSSAEAGTSSERRVFLIPEAVGAIASYLTSLRRRTGIHAVYDFGAGTTDISIFNVFQNAWKAPVVYWYAARNLPHGSHRLERRLQEFLRKNDPSGEMSDLETNKLLNSLEKQSKMVREEVCDELTSIWEQSHDTWRSAYGRLKKQSEFEKEKVQVFVCGGASKLPFVKEIFSESWMPKWGPYPIGELPGPDIYDDQKGQAPFERLCVAYGLTTPEPELGEYKLPRDCPDHTPEKIIRDRPAVYGTTDPDA